MGVWMVVTCVPSPGSRRVGRPLDALTPPGMQGRMARRDASALFGDEHVRHYRETDGEYGHDWARQLDRCC